MCVLFMQIYHVCPTIRSCIMLIIAHNNKLIIKQWCGQVKQKPKGLIWYCGHGLCNNNSTPLQWISIMLIRNHSVICATSFVDITSSISLCSIIIPLRKFKFVKAYLPNMFFVVDLPKFFLPLYRVFLISLMLIHCQDVLCYCMYTYLHTYVAYM